MAVASRRSTVEPADQQLHRGNAAPGWAGRSNPVFTDTGVPGRTGRMVVAVDRYRLGLQNVPPARRP
jgi:hypothetical protein